MQTLSPRPDSISIPSHAREVETLTLSERHFRLSTCRDSILIIQAKTPYSSLLYLYKYYIYTIDHNSTNIILRVPSRASHLFPSIWLSCLAALLAGILIRSSDYPSLCCTAVQERRAARAVNPRNCHQKFISRYNEFEHLGLWRQKLQQVMVNIPPDSQPINHMRIGLRDSSKGSQHRHLAVWSIEGTDLNPSPLTQHDMQKIRWAIAIADVKSGKPYACRFVDRSNKDEQGKSPTMTLNSDTKTKQESCSSGRVAMYTCKNYTGTNAQRSSPSLCFGSV